MSLYNLVTDNFKEYDFDTEYWIYHASTVLFPIKKILNIDKYFVCESRDMSDESRRYLYNSFKIKNYFVHLEIA